MAVLGGALLLTKRRADRVADDSIARALAATQASIEDALASRSLALRQLAAGLARVPTYVSRIGEALRSGNRANLLDQADEFRAQTGAEWALIIDNIGVLKARTDQIDVFDEDFSQGSLIGIALGGEETEGIWIEGGPDGDVLYQAVGVPILSPGRTALYGILVAAVPIDSNFAGELKRHTNSDVVFVVLDTLGLPAVGVGTIPKGSLVAAMGQEPSIDSVLGGLESGASVRWSVDSEDLVGVVGPLSTASGVTVGGFVGLRSRDAELAAFTELSETIRLVFIAGLALAIVSSGLVARQITRPVRQLVAATRRVGEGQYSAEISIGSRDEIGQLATAFKQMVQELKDKQNLVEYLSGAGKTMALTAEQAAQLTSGDAEATRVLTEAGRTGMLTPGMTLANRYEIKKTLGIGGMGVVYRAHDRQLDEVVAIKTLRPEALATDKSSLERFKQEIRLARRITHRNVVRTHDLGEVAGMHYITMEFVEGVNLKDLIKKRGSLPLRVAVTVGKQLCRALEVAHEQGIIHRDVKPQNIVVDPGGFIKVMDFGIARLAEAKQPGQEGLTAAGAAIGTPEYMAPEQLMGEELDTRADLYATGAVLYECVTGHTPFSAPTIPALMFKHVEEPPEDPRVARPDLPPELADLILKALAKRREERWQSAEEMFDVLDQMRSEAGAAT